MMHMGNVTVRDADSAQMVWRQIRRLMAEPDVVANDHRFMRRIGLTAGPVRMLRALLSSGPQPMHVLADRLGCDKSYVTGLVRPLLAKSLVTLEPDGSDGRVKIVSLTAEGRDLARDAQLVYDTPPMVLSAQTPETLERLRALLDMLQ
jgi:DNA-binding MarR family transcriptional regulator